MTEQDRETAITALGHLDKITAAQFGAFGPHPWFISVAGVSLIRKEWEDNPFVKLV